MSTKYPSLLHLLGAVLLLLIMSPLLIIAGACEGVTRFYSLFFKIYLYPPMSYEGRKDG